MTRELTGREKRFLKEAKRQAPNKGDVFGVAKVGAALGMTSVEAHDIVRMLEREFGEVGYVTRIPGNVSDGLGEGVRAVLTDRGRELPLQLAEDERAERRARNWRRFAYGSNAFWVVLVLLGTPFYERYVERRLEREQGERTIDQTQPLIPPSTPTPSPTSQP